MIGLRATSPILLYHGTYTAEPADLRGHLHNVSPDALAAHLTWMQRRFAFVPLPEWLATPRRKGLAVLTFDDAYTSVFTEALPVLRALGIPATVFVNGCTLDGGVFWRDHVRLLLTSGLVPAFLDSLPAGDPLRAAGSARFYRASKTPALNSRTVAEAVAAFLTERGLMPPPGSGHCLSSARAAVDDPLITYGCHTYNHYVLSSLTAQEQAEELARNTAALALLPNRLDGVLALPFGGTADVNATTLRIAREAGFTTVLMSRRRLNGTGPLPRVAGVAVAERLMPESGLPALRQRLARTLRRALWRQIRHPGQPALPL